MNGIMKKIDLLEELMDLNPYLGRVSENSAAPAAQQEAKPQE